jgi:transcription elongation factor GreA
VETTNAQVLLTAEGWGRLHDELAVLRRRRAEALSPELAEAQGWPRPSEQSISTAELEYLNHCISELEFVLARAVPVQSTDLEPGVVGVGSKVGVAWDDGSRETYTIVGPPEVAPRLGRISYVSPVGLALMGRRAGQEVTVVTEDRVSRIKVTGVE